MTGFIDPFLDALHVLTCSADLICPTHCQCTETHATPLFLTRLHFCTEAGEIGRMEGIREPGLYGRACGTYPASMHKHSGPFALRTRKCTQSAITAPEITGPSRTRFLSSHSTYGKALVRLHPHARHCLRVLQLPAFLWFGQFGASWPKVSPHCQLPSKTPGLIKASGNQW